MRRLSKIIEKERVEHTKSYHSSLEDDLAEEACFEDCDKGLEFESDSSEKSLLEAYRKRR